MYLSIIIPALNEGHRLPKTLDSIIGFLNKQAYESEIVIIDNASTDDTFQVAKSFSDKFENLKVISEQKRGKGFAVQTGMLAANGEYRFMCDSDLSMPIEELPKFLPPLCKADVAIGSREAKGAVRINEPWQRHFIGRVFNILIKLLVLPGISDTQCGFKVFRKNVVKEIYAKQRVGGWAFDVELLLLTKRAGFTLKEIPINWYYITGSKVKPIRDSVRMLRELLVIRRNVTTGHYDEAPELLNG